ncbi:MAG: hypothetical protein WCJ62_04050 [Flavobacterium sp.]
MSERWKYQIKTGGFWGIFMTLFNILFELKEKPFSTQISNPNLYLRAFFYLVTGIFLLGYFNWKQLEKRKNSNKN